MCGIEFVPIEFEIADDLAYWRAEIPGRVIAEAEALSGPMTPPGKRVQTINAPGSETGPGTVATWGRATANEVDSSLASNGSGAAGLASISHSTCQVRGKSNNSWTLEMENAK